MVYVLVGGSWAGLVALLIARAVKQFQSYRAIETAAPPAAADAPQVSVVVPARNEARNIERCLTRLAAQDYPADRFEVIVVNDHSTDGTGEIVAELARRDGRIRLVEGSELPPGWTGKCNACWQGAQAARHPWLCFVDADTAAEPALLSAAMHAAVADRLDLLSLEPLQELGTFWERLIIPSGMLLVAFTQDIGRVNDPASPEATANGQFLLFRREAYEAIGGHRAARQAICEDRALAQAVKRSGRRLALLGAERFIRTRMYRSLGELWEGFSKNVTEMLGGTGATLAAAAAGLFLASAAVGLPAWIAVDASAGPLGWAALGCAAAGTLALAGTHIGTAHHLKIPWWYGCLFPLGYVAGALLAVDAVLRRARGSVAWKGRAYAAPE